MSFRYYLCLLSFLCFFGTLFSQEKDSLQQLSFKELKSSYSKFQFSNPKTAKIYAEALIKKAIKEKDDREKYSAFIKQAYIESYLGNLSEAISLLEKSINYFTTEKDEKMLLVAISRKGTIYYDFGKYDKAIKYYLKVDSLARITKNINYQIFSNQGIGGVKTVLGKHKEAAKLFLKNKVILEPLKNDSAYTSSYVSSIIGLCSAYTYFDLNLAEKYLPIIKESSINSNDKDGLGFYHALKGIIFYLKKEYHSALKSLNTADSLMTTLGRKRNLFPVYRFQGKAYYDIGNFEKSITVLEKIKVLKKAIDLDHFEYQEIISLLAKSYDTLGQLDKALENSILGLKLSDANDSIEKALNFKVTHEYDNKTWQEKIDLLTKKGKEKEQQNTSLIYLSIGLVIILLLFFILYQRNQTNNKKKFEILLQKLQKAEAEKIKKSNTKTTKEKIIPDDKISKILDALQKFEISHSFLNKNTSLTSVAKKLSTNTSYLSKIINKHKGLTFINYITKLRIDYALEQLKNDKVLRSYSIKGIAEELGFKSEGAFSRAFKKQTGIYPSFFIKNLTADS